MMRLAFLATCTVILTACQRSGVPMGAPRGSKSVTDDFEGDAAGKVPAKFKALLTGEGGPVRWEVQEAADAPSGKKVVAQLSAEKTNRRYPILIRDDVTAKDVDVSVRFRTLSGELDASAGIVWRCTDKDNYYVARANALEGNVVAYKTEKGRRSSIGVGDDPGAYGVDAKVPHREWNTLRVVAKGNRFEIHLNGKKVFDVRNDTFAGAGKIGIWTKADAVTQFDDLTVTVLDGK